MVMIGRSVRFWKRWPGVASLLRRPTRCILRQRGKGDLREIRKATCFLPVAPGRVGELHEDRHHGVVGLDRPRPPVAIRHAELDRDVPQGDAQHRLPGASKEAWARRYSLGYMPKMWPAFSKRLSQVAAASGKGVPVMASSSAIREGRALARGIGHNRPSRI